MEATKQYCEGSSFSDYLKQKNYPKTLSITSVGSSDKRIEDKDIFFFHACPNSHWQLHLSHCCIIPTLILEPGIRGF